MTKTTMVMAMAVAVWAAPAAAQAPVEPVPAAEPAGAPAMTEAPAAIPVGSRIDAFLSTYEDGGRRDPFASLVAPRQSGSGAVADMRPRRGLAAIALADVLVRGIVRSGETMMAILEGPNKQSFVARTSDELLDARVATIDVGGVVFAQQFDASMTPNHVRKSLRAPGEELR